MSISEKALAVVCVLVLTLSGLYLVQGIAQHSKELKSAILAEERVIDAMVEDLERYVYASARARLRYVLENNPQIPQAFAARDRARLLEVTRPRYGAMREETPSLHAWDFNLLDGTVFLRVQDPAAFGDNIGRTRAIVGAVHESRAPLAGYDVGRHGAIYWIAQPVFHEGSYVGATELGLEPQELLGALRERFDTEVALVVRAEEWRKAIYVREGYRVVGDHVLIAPAGSSYMRIADAAVLTAPGDQQLKFAGRELILHKCATLRDFRGALTGSILVLQDVTERLAHRRLFVAGSVLATGLLLAVCFGVLYASFHTLIGRLEISAAETRHAKDELEHSRDLLGIRVQERTADLWTANRTLETQVAELVRMGQELREAHERLLLVLESIDATVYVADLTTYEILYANRFATETFGELLGKPCWRTLQSGQEGPCSFCTNRKLVGADGLPTGANSWEFYHAARERWYAIQERAIRWVDGRLVRLAVVTDTTARHEAEEPPKAPPRPEP